MHVYIDQLSTHRTCEANSPPRSPVIQPCCKRCSNRPRNSQRQVRQQALTILCPCMSHMLPCADADQHLALLVVQPPCCPSCSSTKKNQCFQIFARGFQSRYSRQQQNSPATIITMSPFAQVSSCLPPERCTLALLKVSYPLNSREPLMGNYLTKLIAHRTKKVNRVVALNNFLCMCDYVGWQCRGDAAADDGVVHGNPGLVV